MNTEALNRWLSLGANLGVLVGIIFLAIEIRQNTDMTRAQITQSRAEVSIAMTEMTISSEYLPAIRAKIDNSETLTQEQAIPYQDWLRAIFRSQDNNIQQYKQGLLGEHIPRALPETVRVVILSSPVALDYWNRSKLLFSNDHIEFVDNVIAENN